MELLSTIDEETLKNGGAVALLIVAVIMILRGDIVPRKLMSDRIVDKDAIIDTQGETIDRLVETNNKLLQESSVTVKLLDTLNKTLSGEEDG